MANKTKKKRNKRYQGADAALTRPTVTRITAANRSKVGQWWFDHKRVAKPIIIASAIIIAITLLILQIIEIATS